MRSLRYSRSGPGLERGPGTPSGPGTLSVAFTSRVSSSAAADDVLRFPEQLLLLHVSPQGLQALNHDAAFDLMNRISPTSVLIGPRSKGRGGRICLYMYF